MQNTPNAQPPLLGDADAVLVLEDGQRFIGSAYGARGSTVGEAVFATGMTGYQETLTDPSNVGQIVVMTAPHIGVTGVNDEDKESERIWVSGFVVRDPSRRASNFRAQRGLDDELTNGEVVGIAGIDTRMLTRILRGAGVMRAGIFSGDDFGKSPGEQLEQVRESTPVAGRNLSAQVSTPTRYSLPAEGDYVGTVAVLDLGVKASTLKYLTVRGFDVNVLPQTVSAQDVLDLAPSAVFFSNGPGDQEASEEHVQLLRSVLDAGIPFFGICVGNQLLGRALGFDTYTLPFGHRRINQPVMDKAPGRVEIRTQNNGFAVRAPIEGVMESPNGYGGVEVTHYSVGDEVVQGLRCLDHPAFSVQFNPESNAGPHDTNHLFDTFARFAADRGRQQSGLPEQTPEPDPHSDNNEENA